MRGLVRLRCSRSAGSDRARSAAWRRSSRRRMRMSRWPPGAQRGRSGQGSQSVRANRATRSPVRLG